MGKPIKIEGTTTFLSIWKWIVWLKGKKIILHSMVLSSPLIYLGDPDSGIYPKMWDYVLFWSMIKEKLKKKIPKMRLHQTKLINELPMHLLFLCFLSWGSGFVIGSLHLSKILVGDDSFSKFRF